MEAVYTCLAVLPVLVLQGPAEPGTPGLPDDPHGVSLGGAVAHIEEAGPLGGPGGHHTHSGAHKAVVAVVDERRVPWGEVC